MDSILHTQSLNVPVDISPEMSASRCLLVCVYNEQSKHQMSRENTKGYEQAFTEIMRVL
ncbi:hypothetical protein AMELA_G00122050 [Ameiurus melas]|uniref:Uncharacterized protein n=1 Tax=Ameiurus melas TaxID=219545 RepID=A0A7J6APG6_AMEME|nr:hypothetical protein AMELA_G00122050 [Ameiurus melas]